MVTSSKGLSGMNEISQYVRRSHDTVLNWIRTRDFPAKKIGGVWESDRELIDDWRKGVITAPPVRITSGEDWKDAR